MVELSWVHKLPVVNFLHEVFFDTPPTPEQLKEVLNLFGLVSALMIGALLAVPSSISAEEMEGGMVAIMKTIFDAVASVEGVGEVEKSKTWGIEHKYNGNKMPIYSAGFNETVIQITEDWDFEWKFYWILSVSLFGFVLFVIFFILMALASTSFRDHNGQLSVTLLVAWWGPIRVVMLVLLSSMVMGVVAFFVSIDFMCLLKTASSDLGNVYTYKGLEAKSFPAFLYYKVWMWAVIAGGVFVFGVLPSSYAGYKRNKKYLELKRGDSLEVKPGGSKSVTKIKYISKISPSDGASKSPPSDDVEHENNCGMLQQLLKEQQRTNELLQALATAMNERTIAGPR